MIIIIGGSSHVGKTLVAQKLLEKVKYPYVSMDHLKMGFIRTGRTELTVEDDYEMRFFLWPYVAEVIKTAIENDQNMIVEGCYVPVNWKESFTEYYMKHIRAISVIMSERYIRDNFSDIVSYASVIEKRLDDRPDMERLIMCSAGFKEDCMKNGTFFYEIDGKYDADDIADTVCKMIMDN